MDTPALGLPRRKKAGWASVHMSLARSCALQTPMYLKHCSLEYFDTAVKKHYSSSSSESCIVTITDFLAIFFAIAFAWLP